MGIGVSPWKWRLRTMRATETYVYDDQEDAARTCDGCIITWCTYAYDPTHDAAAAIAYYGYRLQPGVGEVA